MNRRILVVDDNRAIHNDFQRILCPQNPGKQTLDNVEAALFGDAATPRTVSAFDLDFACQGKEGLELVRRAVQEGRPYAMAFIDVRMPPGWDGVETIARMWQVDPELQIVICTAYSDYSWQEVADKLKQADKFVVLKKPFDVIEVQQLAAAFSAKRELQHQVEERTGKLRESEQRYHFLAQVMPGIVWTARPDGNIDYANARLREYSGLTSPEIEGWGWQQILHSDDLPETLERWNHALQSGTDYQMEYRLRRAADGSYRWHLARATPMRNEKGQIIQWVGTATDIEDQKRTEEALRQTQAGLEVRVQERTRELSAEVAERKRAEVALRREKETALAYLETAEVMMLVLDAQGNVARINQKGCKILEGRPEQIIGRNWPENFLPSAERDKVKEIFRRIMAGRMEFDRYAENLVVTCQGKEKLIAWHNNVVRDDNGAIIGTLSSGEDITERKKAEEALARERDLLRALMDNSPDRIYFRDLQSRFVRVSRSKAVQMLQEAPELRERLNQRRREDGRAARADAELFTGLSVYDVFSEEHARRVFEDEQQIIRSGQPILGKLDKTLHADGRVTWGLTSKLPWFDKDGKIIGTFGISKDVTALKEAEEKLLHEEELLRVLLNSVPDYIYFKDAHRRFTRVNAAQARLLGLHQASEAVGRTAEEFLAVQLNQQSLVDEQRLLVTGEPMTDALEQIQDAKGETIWVSSTKVALRDHDGEITGLVCVSRDMTERQRTEDERRAREESFRALADFRFAENGRPRPHRLPQG